MKKTLSHLILAGGDFGFRFICGTSDTKRWREEEGTFGSTAVSTCPGEHDHSCELSKNAPGPDPRQLPSGQRRGAFRNLNPWIMTQLSWR